MAQHRSRRGQVGALFVVLGASLIAVAGPAGGATAQEPARPAAAERPEIRFTIQEDALLDWLKNVTPYTFSVANSIVKFDLTLSEPRELRLMDSKATLKIRLKGSGLPVDQVLQPVFTLRRDDPHGPYRVVVSSLPVQVPGLGAIDLKDSFPAFEIPELIQDLWKFSDRPIALNLDIRRIAVLEHALEIGADVNFVPAASAGPRVTR